MTTSTTSESSAATHLLDLQALVVAVRRRRRLWCSLALLGFLVGAALAVLRPAPPAAVTKVLVAHEEDQPNDPGTLIRTDVQLLQTTRIADKALQSLDSRELPEDFMRDYRGTGLSNNLLQIDVTGDSDAEAVARAKALADAFVADHVRRMKEAAKAEAKALSDQGDRMRDELAQVNETIGDRSPDSDPKASASIESLFARRAELNSRIADFDQRAEEARVGTPQLIAGTQIVDAARAVPHSCPKPLPPTPGSGSSSGSSSGSRWPRSARWWPTAPCCAGRSQGTWAPRSSRSCATRPAGGPGCGGADGAGRHTNGSPRPWPAPCVAPRNRCRCWNWAVRAARA